MIEYAKHIAALLERQPESDHAQLIDSLNHTFGTYNVTGEPFDEVHLEKLLAYVESLAHPVSTEQQLALAQVAIVTEWRNKMRRQ